MADTEKSGAPVEREEEDDYDLLTFGEAGVRLDQEIRKLAAQVAKLESDPATDAGMVAAQQKRLGSLRDAAARNARQPITDENFTKFFGYDGKARRNTT